MADQRRQIRVSFRKQLSDGNYGSETAEVTIDEWVDDMEGPAEDVIAQLLNEQARRIVHEQLSRSPSHRVREALLDHDERARAWAESNVNAEMAATGAQDDDDEELPI